MRQPPLTHHYLVLHRGGPKRVTRRSAGSTVRTEVESHSITLASAGTNHEWVTEGPIGFVHLYLTPAAVDEVVRQEFDRDPRHFALVDGIGLRLPLLAALLEGLEREIVRPSYEARLLLDTLLHHVVVQLVAASSNVALHPDRARHAIAPNRLARVLDFIEANLASDLSLAELAIVAGSSRYHFSRSFREATGLPPYRYLVSRRIDAARRLLLGPEALPVGTVAERCGFSSRRQFEATFRRMCATSPGRYRRDH